jgi:4-hydroxy-2-oxovalerate aldolase
MRAGLDEMTTARLAVLLLPGVGTLDDLVRAHDTGASLVRIATHSTEGNIAGEHLSLARRLGMTTVGFLMMAHLTDPDFLARQGAIMASAGAEVVYVTDSAGAMLPDDVTRRVAALRQHLTDDVEIGFHGHHNLALGVANSMAAVEAGATWIDGSTCGLGAGAGNTPTEVFVAVCDRMGIETGVDVMNMADAAEDVVRPILDRPVIVDRAALILGYAGVYSSFLLHAERAADRFGVPTRDLLLEVARRKAIGGQEDIIIEIAALLAAAKSG